MNCDPLKGSKTKIYNLKFNDFSIAYWVIGRSNKRKSKNMLINKVVTIKFRYWLLGKRGAHAIYLITSGKQMSNNSVPFFNIIDFVVITTSIEPQI